MTARFVKVKKAAEMTGYSENAIRHKMKSIWTEGDVWFWGQDNVILIDMEAYDQWAIQGKLSTKELQLSAQHRPSSTSATKVSNVVKGSSVTPLTPLTLSN